MTITDKIPQHTTYVENSADNGGVYADGALTWKLHLEAGESKTVTFRVKVAESNVTVINQATALEGDNELQTNAVKTPVKETPATPDTGDNSNLQPYIIMMTVSGAGALGIIVLEIIKKRQTRVR